MPASALAFLADTPGAVASPAGAALLEAHGVQLVAQSDPPRSGVFCAPDAEAHALARRFVDAETRPDREALRARAIGARIAELAGVGGRLRRECPWDREQSAETIVPHTVEEAFEVAEAVAEGDDERLADEIGDLLFQSVFLAALLEERGPVDLATVAKGQADKLIRRHPHVYGDEAARSAGAVVDIWERTKREERAEQGIFHDLPVGLPALAYATKAQKRAAAVGFTDTEMASALERLRDEVAELEAEPSEHELGDVIFAAVAVARSIGADSEIALRAAAGRFRRRLERAARIAEESGLDFADADLEEQVHWYRLAHEEGTGRSGEGG